MDRLKPMFFPSRHRSLIISYEWYLLRIMVFLNVRRSAESVEEKKKTYIEKFEKLRENIEKLRERKTKNKMKVK